MLKPLTVKTCTILILFLLQLFWLKRAGLPGRRDPPRPPPTHPPATPLGSGMRPCPQGFVKHILGITEQTDLSSQLFRVSWLKFHAARPAGAEPKKELGITEQTDLSSQLFRVLWLQQGRKQITTYFWLTEVCNLKSHQTGVTSKFGEDRGEDLGEDLGEDRGEDRDKTQKC